MANTITEPVQEVQAQRALRTWVMTFAAIAAFSVAAGLLLAGLTPGVAHPWSGVAFVIAMGLAIVVGLSKTSSA
jgi:hypothetical protein